MQTAVHRLREAGVALLLALCMAGCATGGSDGGLRPDSARQTGTSTLPPAVVARREAEIDALERRRFAAMVAVDQGVLEELLSERLRYCHSDGRCEGKAEFLQALGSGRLRYRSIEVLELQPKVVGNAMVVHGQANVAAESRGQPVQFRMVFTDVYESTATGWRLVAWQSTRLP
jgi:hypothetical protein